MGVVSFVIISIKVVYFYSELGWLAYGTVTIFQTFE